MPSPNSGRWPNQDIGDRRERDDRDVRPGEATSQSFLALVSLGFTQKDLGAGGAYGYGKAGLIRGSAIRTLLAYTCFEERHDDPGVTRRLLAMTYWGPHQIDDARLLGSHAAGRAPRLKVRPTKTERQTNRNRLGLDVRDPADPEQLGTTFLLIEPTVGPDDLARAIECNWWPALMDPTFGASVTDYDGRPIHPRPKNDPVLRSFMRAHEVAVVPQDNSVTTEKTTLRRWKSGQPNTSSGLSVSLLTRPIGPTQAPKPTLMTAKLTSSGAW